MEGFHEALNLFYEIYSPAASRAGVLAWLQIAKDLPATSLCALPPRGLWAACVSHQLCPTSSVPPALRAVESHCVSSRGASKSRGTGADFGRRARALEMPASGLPLCCERLRNLSKQSTSSDLGNCLVFRLE